MEGGFRWCIRFLPGVEILFEYGRLCTNKNKQVRATFWIMPPFPPCNCNCYNEERRVTWDNLFRPPDFAASKRCICNWPESLVYSTGTQRIQKFLSINLTLIFIYISLFSHYCLLVVNSLIMLSKQTNNTTLVYI